MWLVHHFLVHALQFTLYCCSWTVTLLIINPRLSGEQQKRASLFLLPPHTSPLTQPLDKGCFGPLKMSWRWECWDFLTSNPGPVITRHQFREIFQKAWSKSMTMTNVNAGFRTAGIYPLNRLDVADKNKTAYKSLVERTEG